MTAPADLVVAAFAAASLSLMIAVAVAAALTRSGRVAVPNSRSSHTRPTPAGPGIAVPIAVLVAVIAVDRRDPTVVVLATSLALVGFIDDLIDLPASARLGLQGLLAVGTALAADLPLWLVVPAAFATVATINAVNFMDGINGITSLHGALFGALLMVAADHAGSEHWLLVGAALTAGCLGYLPHNFPAARSFPGDSLPYFLAAVFVIGMTTLAVDEPILILGLTALAPYAIDTSTTVLRRFRAGHRLTEAHRDHAYQRLARRSSHTVSTGTFVALSAICSLSMVLGLRFGITVGLALGAIAVGVSLLAVVSVPQEEAAA